MANLLAKWFIKDYQNTEDKKVRAAYGVLSSVVGIVVNLLLSALKLAVGLMSQAVSVVADALNNLSDAGSSLISLVCFKIAAKPADRDHPYGYARIEYVTSMIVAMLVLIVGFELFTSSLDGILNPKTPDGIDAVTAVLLGVAIIAKLLLGLFNWRLGNTVRSAVMKATATDSLSDALSTSAVLVGVIVSLLFPTWAVTPYIDAVMGMLVSILIFVAGLKILNETKNSILGEAPDPEIVAGIEEIVRSYPDILGIHDMFVHQYGPGNTVASLHAEVDGSRAMFDVHDVIDNIEMQLYREMGIICTIHTDPIATDADTVAYREHTEALIKQIDSRLTIHDFRMVKGATHSNLIFDIGAPFECAVPDGEIIRRAGEIIHSDNARYFAVTHVDRA